MTESEKRLEFIVLCCYCEEQRKVSDGVWEKITKDLYKAYSGARDVYRISHSICPPCYEKQIKEYQLE